MPAGPGPASPAALFLAFNQLALQGFGGVLAVAQRELVERRRWMSADAFLELLSIGQVLPGPNIVNMALIFGDRCFGWRGAFAALAGVMTVPLLIVLLLAWLMQQGAASALAGGALRGMSLVAAGLILATALRLAGALSRNVMGVPACLALVAGTVLAIGVLRWPLVAVLPGIGLAAWALAWRRLRGAKPT
ncbi:MAG: chromate transporter [Rubrivivax sp.]